MTPETALATGFSQWLEEVAGGAQPLHKIQQGRSLTPLGTSMRVTKQSVTWLGALQRGDPLPGSARRQAQSLTDLRSAGLVTKGDPEQVSYFGEQVLDAWRRLGVETGLDEHEVVRAAAWCRTALQAGAEDYQDYMRFWILLRELRPAADWFGDPGNLVLVQYLHREDARGYNPFLVLTGLRSGFPPYSQWQAWAQQMQTPAGWETSRLQRILGRVEGFRTRSTGLRAYCQAMEAVYLAVDRPDALVRAASELATT